MANLSYCRFRNTLDDLRDCYENWENVESDWEKRAQAAMKKLIRKIASDYCDMTDDSV